MQKKQVDLEIRRALRIGKFWQDMLNEAAKKGIPPEEFYHSSYQGSDLEGLMHISPTDLTELETYVTWLETQDNPPTWGREFAKQAQKAISTFKKVQHGIARASQKEQDLVLDQLWKKFKRKHSISYL